MSNPKIAYFVNQYPKVSHTFIRREIVELERQGVGVERFALRGWDADAVDPADMRERENTRYVLRNGAVGLLPSVIAVMLGRPLRFLRALLTALTLSRGGDRPLRYHLIYLVEACVLFRWLRRSGASHVHSHFGTNSTAVVMLASALGGPPYSFTVHGPEEFDRPTRLKLREKVSGAAFVAAISSFGRSQLYRWTDFGDWPKVKVVRCGVERSFYEGAPTPVPAVPRLVCVGRLCEQKGQLLLVEACRKVADKSVDFELVLAGDGEMRADVERAIAAAGLDNRVRITGWIGSGEVRDLLLRSRGLVLPSFAEGLPVVIMEAMVLGRPAISTYVAGIPELIRSDVDGLLVPAGDIDALAEAIERFLGLDERTLQQMGEAAFLRATAMHAIETEVEKLRRLFLRTAAVAEPSV